MQVAKQDTIEIGARERAQFRSSVQVCACVPGCVSDVLLHRAYFSSPYSLSSDRSSEPRPTTWKLERGEEKERMGRERKRTVRWGRKRMERKEREDRRRAEAERQQRMERHETERTDGRMEPNERRRSVGLRDEREGEATSSSRFPPLVPPLPP
ncbi:hypothetical protein KUCAC02_000876 [Chaenocephalus aceratus]|uniref:Uncharacterized protein n=1 Tax=Chaenocephalus aceratus TaxID=36190 RepID=A0ACB9XVK2_CHAAC|nr:hypothetical protein KUCAC02_000876 [Chaenocephalus aceratus]